MPVRKHVPFFGCFASADKPCLMAEVSQHAYVSSTERTILNASFAEQQDRSPRQILSVAGYATAVLLEASRVVSYCECHFTR